MRVILAKVPASGGALKGQDRKNYLDDRCGFWADVTAVNSRNNSVDVIADIGITYRNIPVMSREWVNADDNKDYVTAERYLPPVGARVFVLTPSHTVTGAFVLCSGYVRGETETHTLYAQNDNEQEAKNSESERVTQGGWNETEDYSNGNRNFVSADGKIKIAINPAKNDDKSQEKEVSLTAWGAEIKLTEDSLEISLPDNAGYTLTVPGDYGMEADKIEQKTKTGDFSVSVGGSGKFSAKTTSGNMELSAGTGKVELGNSIAKLGGMIDSLLGYLMGVVITSPSGPCVVDPAFITNLTTLKTQWNLVFG